MFRTLGLRQGEYEGLTSELFRALSITLTLVLEHLKRSSSSFLMLMKAFFFGINSRSSM